MNIIDKIEKEHIDSVLNKTNIVIEEEVKDEKEPVKKDDKKEEKKSKISKIKRVLYQEGKDFSVGDLIKIYYKIIENKKERIQIYEGNIIAVKGKGLSTSLKVRKVSYGVGVERTFPLYSPNIAKIDLVRKGKVRRAKLYYLRARSGKSAVIKERINFKKAK